MASFCPAESAQESFLQAAHGVVTVTSACSGSEVNAWPGARNLGVPRKSIGARCIGSRNRTYTLSKGHQRASHGHGSSALQELSGYAMACCVGASLMIILSVMVA